MKALITGAGRGIGKAIAESLAAKGIEVVLVSRTKSEVETVTNTILASGGIAHAFVCDVSDSLAVSNLYESIGSVDILINNAGIAPSAALEATTDEIWSKTFAVNVSAPFYLLRSFIPEMKKKNTGIVINIASTAALEGFRYTSAYTASKHALLGLARAVQAETQKYHIRVATICPGFVRTDVLEKSIENIVRLTGRTTKEAEAELAAMNDSGRIIEPGEVADTVCRIIAGEENSSLIVL